jgi:hypothetical protein
MIDYPDRLASQVVDYIDFFFLRIYQNFASHRLTWSTVFRKSELTSEASPQTDETLFIERRSYDNLLRQLVFRLPSGTSPVMATNRPI